jgi:hypothetical protein
VKEHFLAHNTLHKIITGTVQIKTNCCYTFKTYAYSLCIQSITTLELLLSSNTSYTIFFCWRPPIFYSSSKDNYFIYTTEFMVRTIYLRFRGSNRVFFFFPQKKHKCYNIKVDSVTTVHLRLNSISQETGVCVKYYICNLTVLLLDLNVQINHNFIICL